MDVAALLVVERDAIYQVLATQLVPVAVGRFGDPDPFDELADFAMTALARYEGREVEDFEIRLSADAS